MSISRKQFLQQTGFACASTILPFSKLFSSGLKRATGVDTQHPKNCSQDLRNPLIGYTLGYIKDADFAYYKLPNPGIAKDALYKHEADDDGLPCIENVGDLPDEICDVTDHHFYAIGDPRNDISVLRYHAYYPTSTYEDPVNGHDYDRVPLPCLVIFHPGGFQECISNQPPGVVTICKQLALRGFICITVDYRAGRVKDPDTSPRRVSVSQQLAPYRGIQDGRGAIRSIFKRNAAADRGGHNFKINPNQLFVGGQSAGSIIALGIAYYRNQAMINQVFPVATGSLTVQQALGHINADFYYGEPV